MLISSVVGCCAYVTHTLAVLHLKNIFDAFSSLYPDVLLFLALTHHTKLNVIYPLFWQSVLFDIPDVAIFLFGLVFLALDVGISFLLWYTVIVS